MTNDRKTEERRTEAARRHDDSELIEDQPPTPYKVDRAGGNLQRDVATKDPEKAVRDPDARDRFTKEQELAHGTSSQSDSNRQS